MISCWKDIDKTKPIKDNCLFCTNWKVFGSDSSDVHKQTYKLWDGKKEVQPNCRYYVKHKIDFLRPPWYSRENYW